MVGALLVRPFPDTYSCPCLCLESMPPGRLSVKSNMEVNLYGNLKGRTTIKKMKSGILSSAFLDAWYEWRLSTKLLSCGANGCYRKIRKQGNLHIVSELGGQYEEVFNDVKAQIIDYFTYKAVRTVLHQLYEMNPPQYMWFYNFVATNKPTEGKRFLQKLVKEKQDLAERVMITRLHLYGKWIKVCDHAEMYEKISEENLKLMRERLLETIVWPTDDTSENMDS